MPCVRRTEHPSARTQSYTVLQNETSGKCQHYMVPHWSHESPLSTSACQSERGSWTNTGRVSGRLVRQLSLLGVTLYSLLVTWVSVQTHPVIRGCEATNGDPLRECLNIETLQIKTELKCILFSPLILEKN